VTGRLDGLRDVSVLEAAYLRPGLHLADASLPVLPASDASAAVRQDGVADAVHLELADAMCAGKLAVPVLAVRERAWKWRSALT
jgi:hypothetical protein